MSEMQERLLHVKQRARAHLEEYKEDVQFEHERRITDLQRQHEEHQDAIEALKLEYTTALQKIKDVNAFEMNTSKDAEESMR